MLDELDDAALPLISTIYPLRRHPIVSVRLAMVTAIRQLLDAQGLRMDAWLQVDLLAYLFENLVLELNPEIRRVSLEAWKVGAHEVINGCGKISGIDDYYGLVMTPIGQALPEEHFEKGAQRKGRHDVDKAMKAGDLSLVDSEVMWETRIEGATALGYFRHMDNEDVSYFIQPGSSLSCLLRSAG